VYWRARAKLGGSYGDYCDSINIATPLVFKYDCNPLSNFTHMAAFNLAGGKIVTVDWGDGTHQDCDTTDTPTHDYAGVPSPAQDPYYIQLSGDLSDITQFQIISSALCYGDISKWILPASAPIINLYSCAFTGDLSGWTIPAGVTIMRLYGNTGLVGDLSGWSLPSGFTIFYVTSCGFTKPPRGVLKQIESGTGIWMQNNACDTAALDAFFAYANTYFAINTPVKNSRFRMDGASMGIPTGGNSNTDIVGIKAKYTAAGYTATITIRTS
jgi:hypothetical protein